MDIILAHKQLDFDALASMVAAQKLYPNSVLVMEGKPSSYVQDFLALAKDRIPLKSGHDLVLENITRIVLVDTHELQRAGGIGQKAARLPGIRVIVYDHHPYEGPFKPEMYIEPVGACTTLLVEKIAGIGLQLSPFEATLLALGIYDDTGSLLFENTTVRDVRAVAYLLERGAQLGVIAENLHRPLSDEQKRLLRQIQEHGRVEMFKGIPVYLSYAESPDYVGGLALLTHRVGELEGPETWFLVVKMENRVYIVGRSRGKGLPVNEIIQVFGGSGHARAASAAVKGQEPAEIMARLRSEIAGRVKQPFLVRDIMSYPVKTVSKEAKLGDVEQILLRYGHTGVPVVEDQRLVGIISRRDVEKAIKHGLQHAPVKGFMATNVVTVEADLPWDVAQKLMVQYDIGRLPVVEKGKIVGIVSRSDVLRLIHGSAVPIEPALARERSQALQPDVLNFLKQLPAPLQNILETVRQVAGELELPVYAVGGAVRDLLLFVPLQDMDFVVEGDGPRLAEALAARLGRGELTRHQEFGTASLAFSDGTHLDVASTRWEYYEFPAALPEVEESTLREDLFRRDFTINAMAINLNAQHFGELIDYYGGIRDLQQGEIRLLHKLSFIEDPTRILRAVRFAERYRFKLAKETGEALETALEHSVLRKLSRERFTEELLLIYQEINYRTMGLSLLKLGIMQAWFGEDYPWDFQAGLDDILNEHSADQLSPANAPLNTPPENKADQGTAKKLLIKRWLVSIRRFDTRQAESVLERLRLPRSLYKITRLYFHLRGELETSPRDLAETDRLLNKVPHWLIRLLAGEEPPGFLTAYLKAIEHISMTVSGKVLLEAGLPEGKLLGRILAEIRKAWLLGEISSPEEERILMNRLLDSQRDKEGKG